MVFVVLLEIFGGCLWHICNKCCYKGNFNKINIIVLILYQNIGGIFKFVQKRINYEIKFKIVIKNVKNCYH